MQTENLNIRADISNSEVRAELHTPPKFSASHHKALAREIFQMRNTLVKNINVFSQRRETGTLFELQRPWKRKESPASFDAPRTALPKFKGDCQPQ